MLNYFNDISNNIIQIHSGASITVNRINNIQ